jgi:uncharacterized membrane protein
MTNTDKKPRNWMRIVLVISLGLNLAVVGMVAGFAFAGDKRSPQRFDLTVGPLTRAMDDNARTSVREALRESGVFDRADRNSIRVDMMALVALLRADDFDAAAFQEVLGRQRARLQAGQDTVLRVVTDQINTMTAQDRAAFADRLERQLRRGPPQRRD